MLEVKDLHVKFHSRDREAVGGVSFTIQNGEILGLVGESGSGKSVTAMSIAGLLPRKQCDYSGQILLDGTELLHADRTLLRKVQGKDIGVVFQEPMSAMDPLMKVGRQVEEVLRLHDNMPPQERRRLALEALAAVELPDPEGVYEKYPHELSGGMLQRAMIAAAIVARPKLLLLDEPTTALDVTISAQIFDLMNTLKKEHNTAIMMITHNMGVVAEMADEVAVMYMGNIVEYGPVEKIFTNPSHPYTKALMRSIPVLGKGKNQQLEPIRGSTPDPFNRPKGCQFCPRCDFACERCQNEMPPEEWVTEGHYTRCFNYKEVMASGK